MQGKLVIGDGIRFGSSESYTSILCGGFSGPELISSHLFFFAQALKTARSDHFSSLLEENKHNPKYLLNTVAKLTKHITSAGADISKQHINNDFMNDFTSKIDTIRDQIVTMQPSAILSHQIVYYRSPEEQFHSFSTIGEEELYKLVKSSKPTTCMLDPIPSKLLKELLPEVIDPLLAIINSSLYLGYVSKTFKLTVFKPLIKKPQLDPNRLINYRSRISLFCQRY